MRILVADDDVIPLRILEAQLRRWGYDVIVARDGNAAWEVLSGDDPPRLALLDWMMPGIDGVEICRRLRANQHNGPYVYSLLITGRDRNEDVVAGLESGADDYIKKPFEPGELQVRIHAGQRILDLQSELMDKVTALKRADEDVARAQKHEMEMGVRIQKTLLLGKEPTSVRGIVVAALTLPSREIDGDFYDFFEHDHDCLDMVVGDVMGKGAPAALLGAAVKSQILRAQSRFHSYADPSDLPLPETIISEVHRTGTKSFIDVEFFVTLCYARFNMKERMAQFVDCGHPKTLHIHASNGACTNIACDNVPLGVSETAVYTQVCVPFAPGDLFFFYSDGVTEAMNSKGEQFGEERLIRLVSAGANLDPHELNRRVRESVVEFSGTEKLNDDVTCVAVKILSAPDVAPPQAGEAGDHAPQGLNLPSNIRDVLNTESHLADLEMIRGFISDFCRRAILPQPDEARLHQLVLAVNEAASNIMRHSYGGEVNSPIQIVVESDGFRVNVSLRHHGIPFDPGVVPAPLWDGSQTGGYGVYIIAECTDEVEYAQIPDGTNEVRLVKTMRT